MIFTLGFIMAMIGFGIGHLFGDPHRHIFNKFDYIACIMFILGALGVLSSIFTITWKYMP